MRRIVLVAVVATFLLALVPATRLGPAARAATPAVRPKVVLIVGPVGSLTREYIAWAEAAAKEARKYTPNVVRLYSPKATWERVRTALQGASVVVYLGHGNGWPSKYRTTPWPYSQNGLGLNATAGTSNTNTQYWGEYYLARDVRLAPNAVVLLHRLCYASGNSEDHLPPGPQAVAEQRVDNYAAGWLAAGARVVVAEGHYAPTYYMRSLFTRTASLDRIWATSPSDHGHAYSLGSVRTPGALFRMDPDRAHAGYYRSIAGWPATTASQVARVAYPSTAIDPPSFVVPGAAAVAIADAGLYADAALTSDPATGLPPATLPLATNLRVLEQAGLTPAGAPILRVATLDGGVTGYMPGTDLRPRDSAGPRTWWVRNGTGRLSPNDDGSGDTLAFVGRLSELAAWRVRVRDAAGEVVGTMTGTGQDVTATWNGLGPTGAALPEGAYTFDLAATDGLGNGGAAATGSVAIDLSAPTAGPGPAVRASAGALAAGAAAVPLLTPNGDGLGERIDLPYSSSEAGYVDLQVRNAAGATVRSITKVVAAGSGSLTWDAGNYLGDPVADGAYTVRVGVRDAAGNPGPSTATPVDVYGALAATHAAPTLAFPQDRDSLAKASVLRFTLRSAATLTMTIADAAGNVVYTRHNARSLPKGTYNFTWAGINQAGAMLPRGRYTVTVSATNGTLGLTQKAYVWLDAFRIATTATAAAPARRGRTLTVTAVSAEPLKSLPRLRIAEQGLAARSVAMKKVSATTYRVSVLLRDGGPAGTLDLRVTGVDSHGRTNQSTLLLPLH